MWARLIVAACFVWTWVWLIVGSTPRGKNFYLLWIGRFTSADAKCLFPMLTLALPIFVATVASLNSLRHFQSSPCSSSSYDQSNASHRLLLTKVFKLYGDPSFDRYAFWMLAIPITFYVCMVMYFQIQPTESKIALDAQLSSVSNTFGVASLIALCLMLIPVARHSFILQILQWNPAAAIRLHIWSGRIVIGAALLHTVLHLIRFYLRGYPLLTILIPPVECWNRNEADTILECNAKYSDCSCRNRWRNLFGAVATVGLVIIGISSMHKVRRKMYSVFYKIHVVAGPLVFVTVVLHWNRSLLYLSGGLIYYLMSSSASLLQKRLQQDSTLGVEIVNVEHILTDCASSHSNKNNKQVVAITLKATKLAVANFQAGYYAMICVPDISSIAHPFTINPVPHEATQLRVIFRVSGAFTQRLVDSLRSTKNTLDVQAPSHSPILPRLYLDGYHGIGRASLFLKHDRIVIVAGGIGITPYLSLIQEIHSLSTPTTKTGTKAVVLHWLCREESLISYIVNEHLNHIPDLGLSSDVIQVQIIVHNTKRQDPSMRSYTDLECNTDDLTSTRLSKPALNSTHKRKRVRSFQLSSLLGIRTDRSWLYGSVFVLAFVFFFQFSLLTVWCNYPSLWASGDQDSIFPLLKSLFSLVLIALIFGIITLRMTYLSGLDTFDCEEKQHLNPKSLTKENAFEKINLTTYKTQLCGFTFNREPVLIQRRWGRPSMEDLLKDLNISSTSNPALMLCGPTNLSQAALNCLLRQSMSESVAVYEEKFEM